MKVNLLPFFAILLSATLFVVGRPTKSETKFDVDLHGTSKLESLEAKILSVDHEENLRTEPGIGTVGLENSVKDPDEVRSEREGRNRTRVRYNRKNIIPSYLKLKQNLPQLYWHHK